MREYAPACGADPPQFTKPAPKSYVVAKLHSLPPARHFGSAQMIRFPRCFAPFRIVLQIDVPLPGTTVTAASRFTPVVIAYHPPSISQPRARHYRALAKHAQARAVVQMTTSYRYDTFDQPVVADGTNWKHGGQFRFYFAFFSKGAIFLSLLRIVLDNLVGR
uniref:Uncharacterized protein n=1 Tax=Anopheles melas TaxID=34690 RepID=A0A182TZ35_9DIPT